jgi:ABC-type Fe3+-hydroxamate transport system substrate-binding protein
MPYKIRDDRGRELFFARAPKRVVSLVPSDTYTIAKLAGVDALVGRTDYCVEPAELLEKVPTVGGTKDYDVQKILDLSPDLVIGNQEENTKASLEKLTESGIPVFVCFPKRVEDGVALVARYMRLLGLETDARAREVLRGCHRALEAQRAERAKIEPIRVFCPIWMEPLMTIHGDTFISDALDLAGARNVFADRERRYPLAADLGVRPAIQTAGRDTRYPRVTREEVIERAPEVILLPDEPHPFSEADAASLRAIGSPSLRAVVPLAGKDVCWYGAWSEQGIPRLAAAIRAVSVER